jgi:hypothetical protein
MSARGGHVFREVHRLALAYHWGRREILELTPKQRLRFLMLLEADADADLLAAFGQEG